MTCECLVATADGRVLLVRSPAGGWGLPRLEGLPSGWFPYAAPAVAERLRQDFGVDAYVLRHLRDDDESQFCEMCVIGPEWRPAVGNWFPADGLQELPLEPGYGAGMLREWAGRRGTAFPVLRAPWERPGWLALAAGWIRAALASAGNEQIGPLVPVKLGWSGSAILRVPTPEGWLFFKAAYSRPPNEVDVTLHFARRFPREVPEVVASDRRRRWLLMRDVGGRKLRSMPHAAWMAAVRRFAEIQVDCAADADALGTLGLPRWGAAEVVGLWETMLEALPGPAVPAVVGAEDLASLRRAGPKLEDRCAMLDGLPIPYSLHARDFREANIYARPDGFVFFDWGDSVLAHPFFSLQRLLSSLRRPTDVARADFRLDHPDDQVRRDIRDAYLAVWREAYEAADVQRAYVATWELLDVFAAVHWHEELGYVEPGTPWHQRVLTARSTHLRRILRWRVGPAAD